MEGIPKEFWQSLSEKEWRRVEATGTLDAKLCKRLWVMEGKTEPPPRRLGILVRTEDVKREFPLKHESN
jgi:hypothetical protein